MRGIENGSSINQPYIQSSSVSGNSSTLISVPSTPSLADWNTINGGTPHFEVNCYVSGDDGGDDTGIDELDIEDVTIKSLNGNIIVEGCDNCAVSIFNMEGRRVGDRGLAPSVYVVKVGDLPARKVVVN